LNIFKDLKEGITAIAFSCDEKFLAAICSNNTLAIWNTKDFSLVHKKVLEVPITLSNFNLD